ncbi:hypothetical protein OE766_22445 [Pararhizobium sp. YC-54]|uniref:hypothetical protein n=1 Tax=Pararhizobium sp. YC-54 TaxID=2986920 RepID=UPI0021F7E635|nr:hypothetical protein [Pararhizobium sp. YC-54]MCW0000997.1 hypothetical protein [Pararhizobium sp. YC-54]
MVDGLRRPLAPRGAVYQRRPKKRHAVDQGIFSLPWQDSDPVEDTPHYQLALALAKNTGLAEAEEYYAAYLAASWGAARANEIHSRIDAFKQHFHAFQAGARAQRAILTYLHPDFAAFVVDGNHRFAFAAALGKQTRVEVLPADLTVFRRANLTPLAG